ncbi:MAG: hypothetical protein IPM80_18365 [Proteobacteria bacterium]|nr:hypothetical protein [Pseudomonadota bacterium]
MPVIIERHAARLALLLTGVLAGGVVRAHGEAGGGPACQLRLGAWRVDVALYQPALHDGEMYCDALPGPGATLVVFDVVDAALTAMPIEVRLLRADGDSSEAAVAAWDAATIEAASVARLAPTVPIDGSVVLRHAFEGEGTYLALLRTPALNGGEWRAAWRFSVGSRALRLRQGAVGVAGSALLCGLLAWARRRRTDGTPADLDYGNQSRPAS